MGNFLAGQSRDWPWRFFDLTAALLIALDNDGRVIYINERGAEILDWPVHEILGRDWFESFVPADVREDVRRVFHQVCAGAANAPERFENTVLRSDGSERIIAWRNALARDEGGRVVAGLSAGEDVTDQRRAEAALRESEARFRATFEQSAVGMAHLDLDGRFLRLNRRLCEMTGYSRAELEARSFAEITHPEERAAELAMAEDLRRGRLSHVSTEKRYIRRDGSVLWATITVSLVRDDDGRPQFFSTVVEEISAYKAAEQRQDRMLGEMGHRLGNLLALVQSIARQSVRDGPDREAFLERIGALAAAQHLSPCGGPTDLGDLVAQELSPYPAERVTIVGGPVALGERTAQTLAVVLHELATNAVKHGALSGAQGSVTVTWSLPAGPSPALLLDWTETGGPPVAPPRRAGFGTRILRASIRSLRGRLDQSWPPEGVRVRIRVPLLEPGGSAPA